uniref:chitin deacetylase n=1 Tax=Mycena chlorophos TaxID=658473 RepID=A0ABQ0LJJ4_MYCCL|nr:carbohydrate esterase family 4 protein [Mycena chlorophos]
MSSLRLLFLAALAVSATAQNRTTEAGEASIDDPVAECVPYNYPPVTASKTSFPPIWSPATTIVAGDSAAMATFSAMSSSIPNIAPRGTLMGNFSNVSYPATDPDCWWTWDQCTTPKISGLANDTTTVPEPRTLGFGFDDGPNCSHNAFYDYLTSQNQKATMFYIGSNVMDWPLEAQRAIADGHQICVHTWSHHYMTSFTNEGAFAELYYTLQAIKLVTGVTPTCWRPPYGDVDDRIRYIAKQLNLSTIVWKENSEDWEFGSVAGVTNQTVYDNYAYLVSNVSAGTFNTAGTIMLTHELNNYTMQTAIDNYPKLRAAFDALVPIAVALNITHPYAETNYTMPTFQQYVSNASASASASSASAAAASQTPGSRNGGTLSQQPQVTVGLFVFALTMLASASAVLA